MESLSDRLNRVQPTFGRLPWGAEPRSYPYDQLNRVPPTFGRLPFVFVSVRTIKRHHHHVAPSRARTPNLIGCPSQHPGDTQVTLWVARCSQAGFSQFSKGSCWNAPRHYPDYAERPHAVLSGRAVHRLSVLATTERRIWKETQEGRRDANTLRNRTPPPNQIYMCKCVCIQVCVVVGGDQMCPHGGVLCFLLYRIARDS